jgi:ABC-type transport system involved in multi-copper enzyme maturation permease subunit
MNLLPVIERELRVQARLPFTYWMRSLATGGLLLSCFYFARLDGQGVNMDSGGALFGYMNTALFGCIWVMVPMLAADCISRERREGTLGLLFLTPLKPYDIVLSKGMAHGLRALTLWLAVLPALTIPFLLGGISWREAVLAGLNDFDALCLALAAGILGSAAARAWHRSLLAALLFAVFFMGVFLTVNAICVSASQAASPAFSGTWYPYPSARVRGGYMTMLFYTAHGMNSSWSALLLATDQGGTLGEALAAMGPAGQREFLRLGVAGAFLAMLALLFAILLAAQSVKRSWREEPPPWWRNRLSQILCTPVLAVDFLRRWMRRKLERNPIGWLETRTWSGRLVTWSWFGVMISLYSVAFSDLGNLGGLSIMQVFERVMAWLLILSMAMSAAGSFRRERETGVLELLLVSPMREGQIIGGRLRGLWGQFLPALVILIGVWIYFGHVTRQPSDLGAALFFVVSFLTIPVIGLYFSLRRRGFVSAFLFTIFAALLVPAAAQMILSLLIEAWFPYAAYQTDVGWRRENGWLVALLNWLAHSRECAEMLQLAFAVVVGRRLHSDLTARSFNFTREVTQI